MLDLAIDLPCSDFDLAAVWDFAPKPAKVFGKFGNLRLKTLANYFRIDFWPCGCRKDSSSRFRDSGLKTSAKISGQMFDGSAY